MFATANTVVINKTDVADVMEFDITEAHRNINLAAPGSNILETSAKTGQGVDQWIDWLLVRLNEKREVACK